MDYKYYIDYNRKPNKKTQLVLTERDIGVLEDIYLYGGILSANHIQMLRFAGSSERVRQGRLGPLFHQGFISRTSLAGRALAGTMVYWLTKLGARQVAASLEREDVLKNYMRQPKFMEIRHDLKIVDVLIAVRQACSASNTFEFLDLVVERELRSRAVSVSYTSMEGRRARQKVVPDAFFVIDRVDGERTFRSRLLLEIDFATHPNKRFAETKVLPGVAWLRSEDYTRRFGAARGRWLVVTKSMQRLGFLKRMTEIAARDDAQVWYFSTFDQVHPDTFLTAPIWYRAGDEQPIPLFRFDP